MEGMIGRKQKLELKRIENIDDGEYNLKEVKQLKDR
jgi:hypothetical protein